MSPVTDTIVGCTEVSPDAAPGNHCNLTSIYIDDEAEKSIPNYSHDKASKKGCGPQLTMVYINHCLDSPGSPGINTEIGILHHVAVQDINMKGRRGLFHLPLELRIVIWELLLPGKRLLRAQAWYGRDRTKEIKGRKGRWFFRVYDWDFDKDGTMFYLEVPVVMRICRESRSIALQHGSIIFGNDYDDAGTWWNSDRDVLGFDHAWEFDQHPQALTDLRGLNRVKHIAVDERQARYFGYEAWYNGTVPDKMPRELRRPAAVVFTFRESYESENYILEFFPHFQQLTIIFLTSVSRRLVGHWKDIPEVEKAAEQVTFRLGSDIDTALKQLRKYRNLFTITTCYEEVNIVREFRTVTGPVYAVENDDVDIDRMPHMMYAGFGIYRTNQELPI
ncbi:hypothetical protein F5883DRAFT_180865 [Diaporthe sp. PMI_573]|nr:hypothetical protein F5883DRAFT_180865 [Diaporthaceae sp. PMI_573]